MRNTEAAAVVIAAAVVAATLAAAAVMQLQLRVGVVPPVGVHLQLRNGLPAFNAEMWV